MNGRLLINVTQGSHGAALAGLLNTVRAEARAVAWLDLSPGGDADASVGRLSKAAERVDPRRYAAEAHRRIRESFPAWLHAAAAANGLLDLWSWRGHVSVWWLAAISEMSALRTPLIHTLYQLQLVDQVVADRHVEDILLLTDDPLLVPAVRQLAARHGATLSRVVRVRRHVSLRQRVGRWQALRRGWFALQQSARWAALRLAGVHHLERVVSSRALQDAAVFCTMFPSMWERPAASAGWHNRSFGDWPSRLGQLGHEPVFATITMVSGWHVLRRLASVRSQLAATRSVPLESMLPWRTVLAYCLGTGWIGAYRRWRAAHPCVSARFDGIDVGPLLLRELDQDLQSPEVSLNLCVAEGTYRLATRLARVACATHAFEYQPMEKAFASGLSLAHPEAPVVGFQTGLTGSNHLGYWFPREQVLQRPGVGERWRAPVPDLIAVNGRTTFEVLRRRLDPDRLALTGPVRLEHLWHRHDGVGPVVRMTDGARGVTSGSARVPVMTTAMPDESWFILREVFAGSAVFPDVVFLIKSHPLCPVDRQLSLLARQYRDTRYKVCSQRAADLLRGSRVVITGATSVGVEAIHLGCMPIVYDGCWRYDGSPMRDVEDAVFFFRDAQELREALAQTLADHESARRRRERWPAALEALCHAPGGDPGGALCDALRSRGLLAP